MTRILIRIKGLGGILPQPWVKGTLHEWLLSGSSKSTGSVVPPLLLMTREYAFLLLTVDS